jgi:hypothetical protein
MLGIDRPPSLSVPLVLSGLTTGAAYFAASSFAAWRGLPEPGYVGAAVGFTVGTIACTGFGLLYVSLYAMHEWASVQKTRAMYGGEELEDTQPVKVKPIPVTSQPPAPDGFVPLNTRKAAQTNGGQSGRATAYHSTAHAAAVQIARDWVDPAIPDGVDIWRVYRLARGVVVERKGLTFDEWIGEGKPFSRPAWEYLVDWLTRAYLVRKKEPTRQKSTIILTELGERWFEDVLHAYGPHSPAALRRAK